ncbi:protein of unknown function [Agreia sp. COWG]|nr:protein of unknown function [Agreia sp. COWG]
MYQSSDWADESGRCLSRITASPWELAAATTLSMSCSGVRLARSGFFVESMDDVVDCARHWFEKGSLMVLNPMEAIDAIPSSSEIDHRPCGAQLDVSIPNQETDLMMTGVPLLSMIEEPSVRMGAVITASLFWAAAGLANSPRATAGLAPTADPRSSEAINTVAPTRARGPRDTRSREKRRPIAVAGVITTRLPLGATTRRRSRPSA